MDIKKIDATYSVSEQLTSHDLATIKGAGIRAIVCNRPDGEAADQPSHIEIERMATTLGIGFRYIPIEQGILQDEDVSNFKQAFNELPKPVLAYCQSGRRSAIVWSLATVSELGVNHVLEKTAAVGFDMMPLSRRLLNGGKLPSDSPPLIHDIVIIGGGAAGLAVCSSLLKRRPDLDIALIEPSDIHYYQPGWTMVGGGIFKADKTVKTMSSLIPAAAKWIKAAVAAFGPDKNNIILEDCRIIQYKNLIVCPGLKLNWGDIEGLEETIGQNGVTSNYRFDLAPYTWQLIKNMNRGKSLFTQPPLPIKCTGAPQKAMYLAADHWFKNGSLNNIQIKFMSAGAALFSVEAYIPALMSYIKRYQIALNFRHNLIKIDGKNKKAWFEKTNDGGEKEIIEESFDIIHICPPQQAPDFIKVSPLADAAGWVDVDQKTLRHKRYDNIYALGDVTNTPNAKTAAAARKQAPIVAHNLLTSLDAKNKPAFYDGYGSCPLTVERGKVVLAEFGYGGKLLPSFPQWLLNGKKPSRLAWFLKARLLPLIYWKGMLKGREWLVAPKPQRKRL